MGGKEEIIDVNRRAANGSLRDLEAETETETKRCLTELSSPGNVNEQRSIREAIV